MLVSRKLNLKVVLASAAVAGAAMAVQSAGTAYATDAGAAWNTTTGAWNVASNWLPATVPANGSGTAYNVIIAPTSASTVNLNGMGTPTTIGSLSLKNNATIENSGATVQTLIIDPASLTTQVVTSISGNIDGSAGSGTGGIALQFGSGNATTVNATVSGNLLNNLSLTVNEPGATITLSGTNTYTGVTTITNGTLKFTGSTAGLAGNVADNGALVFDQTAVYGLSGVISGTGTVTQAGTSDLVLFGNNTYAGVTTINSGLLVFDGSTTGLTGNVLDNGGMGFSQTTASSLSGVISGGGYVYMAGSTVLTLSGANTYTGGSYLFTGAVVNISAADNLGAGGISLSGTLVTTAPLTESAAVTLDSSGSTINDGGNADAFSGVFSGSGGLNKMGAGTLTLSNAETYTGGTTITNGMLALASAGSLANSNITIDSGATLSGMTSVSSTVGTLNFNINGNTSDLITDNGTLDITNLNLALDLTGTQTQSQYVLADYVGGTLVGSAFASVTGLQPGWTIDYSGTSLNPNSIVLSRVPEPAALGLLALGGLALLVGKRRRA